MATAITYNSFSLQDSTYNTNDIKRYTIPDKKIQTFPLSYRDNAKVVSSFYGTKIIKLSGYVYGSTEANLQSNISTLRRQTAVEEATLAIPFNSKTLNYQATY